MLPLIGYSVRHREDDERMAPLWTWLEGGYLGPTVDRGSSGCVLWTDPDDTTVQLKTCLLPVRAKFTGWVDRSHLELTLLIDAAHDELGGAYLGVREQQIRTLEGPLANQAQLRKVPVSDLIAWVIASSATWIDTTWTHEERYNRERRYPGQSTDRIPWDVKPVMLDDIRPFVRRGRPTPERRKRHQEERLRVVADAYRAALADGEPTTAAVVSVLQEFDRGMTDRNRRQWEAVARQAVRKARESGLLAPSNNRTRPRPT